MKVLNLDKNQKMVHKKVRDGSWLSSEAHTAKFFEWNTFFRRNLHRFVELYLGIQLHFYQKVLLFFLGISRLVVAVAARAAAKSFIIALYSCCRAILYPGTRIVLTSGTRGQSGLIVSEKIAKELYDASPNLRREIKRIVTTPQDTRVDFHNGSSIVTVTLSKNSRGNRSHVNVAEEAREIDKEIYDTVVNPFLVVRQPAFVFLDDYKGDPQFQEEPTEIFISSSTEESHWLYKLSKDTMSGALNGDGRFFIAFDYSVTLKHGIRSRLQMLEAKRKADPITWMVEYENRVLRSNSKAYFTYDELKDNQTVLRAFYPRKTEDFIARAKNPFAIKKQPGEIRVVSCDIAAIDRSGNDNSSFSCLRLFEEATTMPDGRVERTYRVPIPYLEAIRGQETRKQAIRIKQLYDDFDADYIVLDCRNIGLAVYDYLARPLYDDERGVEYPPFTCMNDEDIASRIVSPNAEPRIFSVLATANLNSDIAVNFKSMLMEHRVDLLVPKEDGIAEIYKLLPALRDADAETQLFYERPYLETMLAVNEMINLVYEKKTATGLISISEVGRNTKDRYTSISYGCWFASRLARDLLNSADTYDWDSAPSCVSSISF